MHNVFFLSIIHVFPLCLFFLVHCYVKLYRAWGGGGGVCCNCKDIEARYPQAILSTNAYTIHSFFGLSISWSWSWSWIKIWLWKIWKLIEVVLGTRGDSHCAFFSKWISHQKLTVWFRFNRFQTSLEFCHGMCTIVWCNGIIAAEEVEVICFTSKYLKRPNFCGSHYFLPPTSMRFFYAVLLILGGFSCEWWWWLRLVPVSPNDPQIHQAGVQVTNAKWHQNHQTRFDWQTGLNWQNWQQKKNSSTEKKGGSGLILVVMRAKASIWLLWQI